MSAVHSAAVVSLLLGAGAWCIAVALRRAPASLAAAREQMVGRTSLAPARWSDGLATGVVGECVRRRFDSALDVVDLSVADVITKVVTSAGIILVTVSAAVATLTATGLFPFGAYGLVLAPLLAALAGWVTVHDIAARIERRRREFRQAANDFVQLVAVGLTTDQSVEEAIRFALDVGDSDAFDALRVQVSTAPQRGVPVWDAIDEFGHRFGVREMCEFAASIERQGMQGVSISETVASLATAMRAKALDQLEREADKANANLSGPTVGFVVTTIVFLAYPLAQRVSDAFGG